VVAAEVAGSGEVACAGGGAEKLVVSGRFMTNLHGRVI
jgi:hypothetical protein